MAFPRIAAFSPKGGEVAVVGADVIRRHELPSGRMLAEYPAPNPRILQLVYSSDGNHLGAVWRNSQQSIRVIDVRTGIPTDHKFDELREGPQAHNVSTLAIDTDAQRIAVGAWSGRIAVRDFASGTTRVVSSHAGTVWDLDFATHDRGLLISSSGSGGITFWDLDTYEVCYQDQRLAGPLSYVALSPDGRTMFCRTLDAAVLVNLAYRDRHVASMLDPWLELTSAEGMPKTARVLELQAWAERARAEPPFRWGK
jgi:WD40 repeat protein